MVRDGTIGPPIDPALGGLVPEGFDDDVTPDQPNGQHADYLIRADLGEQRSGNLFHSFEQFSIGTGETATFTAQELDATGALVVDPSRAIDHVISRVTGMSESRIDGTVRSTIDGADIWLMNPNGIVFGERARLDVRAGFHASTANQLEFESGGVFKAEKTAAIPPLLQVDPPEAFGFLDDNIAKIELAPGGKLAVQNGSYLEIVGNGAVTLNGTLSADNPSGAGDVKIHGNTVDLLGPSNNQQGRVSVSANGSSGSGGSVVVEADSTLRVGPFGMVSADGYSAGGHVELHAASTVAVEPFAEISAIGSAGTGGTIRVGGDDASVSILGRISADGVSRGGDVEVFGRTIALGSPGFAPFIRAASSAGTGGAVSLAADEWIHTGLGSVISADGYSGGGDVRILGNTVELYRARSDSSHGDGGKVAILAENITLGPTTSDEVISVDGASRGGDVIIYGRIVAIHHAGIGRDTAISADSDLGVAGNILLVGDESLTMAAPLSADGFTGGGVVTMRGYTIETGFFSVVSVSALDSGDGGSIRIAANTHQLPISVGSLGASEITQVELQQSGGSVIRDGSLGNAAAGRIPAEFDADGAFSDYLIGPGLGRKVGHNLFHSFSQFDVAPWEIATFTGPESLHHIVARVTGIDPSEIYGTVRSTAPNADLFLLNPWGILFGRGAQLDVAGSFHLGTADRLEFTDDEMFEARQDGAVPAFVTALPGEFAFLNPNASIGVEPGAFLAVREGASLSLEAGDTVAVGGVLLGNGEAAVNGATIQGTGGAVAIGSMVSASDDSAGNVTIRGRRVMLNGTPLIRGNAIAINGSVGISTDDVLISGRSVEVNGAELLLDVDRATVRADDEIRILNGAEVIRIPFSSSQNAVELVAPIVEVDSSLISVAGRVPFHAVFDYIEPEGMDDDPRLNFEPRSTSSAPGTLRIEASSSLHVRDGVIEASSFATESAGEIRLDVRELILDHASIDARTFGPGSGGNVVIAAQTGSSGSATLPATRITLANDSQVSASAGPVDPETRARFETAIVARLEREIPHLQASYRLRSLDLLPSAFEANGVAGDVRINSDELSVSGNSSLSSSSFGVGDAGSVEIEAREVRVEGTGSRISVLAEHANGGDVTLVVGDRLYLDGGMITADVGDGIGGSINVRPALANSGPTFVILDDGRIVANALEEKGKGGEITIDADAFVRDAFSRVKASAVGGADLSGTVNINAPEVDLAGSLAALSDSALDASDQLAARCSARRRGETEGTFTVARGTLRPGPEGWLPAWSPAEAPPFGSLSLASTRCY